MAEKILNARFQLRHDTLAHWTTENPELKKGEIAVATIDTANPANKLNPPVMFKVGPGNFNDLDWASALAADVYAWAKQSENDFVDTFLALKMTDGTTMQQKLDGVFATDKELSDAVAALEAAIDEVVKAAITVTDVENNPVSVTQEGTVYTVSHDTIDNPTETDGTGRKYLTGVTTDGYGHITGFTTATENVVDTTYEFEGLPVAEGGNTPSSVYFQVKSSDAEAAEAIYLDAYNKSEVDSKFVDIEAWDNRASHTEEDINGIEARLDAIDGENGALVALNENKADKSTTYTKDEIDADLESLATSITGVGEIATDAQRKIDTFMGTVESSTDVVDTLEEIIALINSEDAELSEALLSEINGLKAKFNTDGKALEAVNADTVDGKHATDFATAAQGATADTTAATIATYGNIVTHAVSEFATAEQGTKADNAAATIATYGDIVTKNWSDVTAADAQVLADAKSDVDTKLANYTNTEGMNSAISAAEGRVNESIDAINETIGEYGDIVTYDATDFATAAQGATADTAVQTVTAPAGSGLTATRTDNDIVLGFDDTVVFVFDGGDAFDNPLNA